MYLIFWLRLNFFTRFLSNPVDSLARRSTNPDVHLERNLMKHKGKALLAKFL
ncbi:hypothetical protein RchiOBHm_Chr5g0061381 [Rosa chinensis]|uniref:Uncharacterized protein n=1 Tax=Rosa chinensis TaxID=74649 RepID=A0A2P6QHX5_ROSCH|nr:hypothetical protein RchiOBHm_Chr5g0061381 [Rosa chinensis]